MITSNSDWKQSPFPFLDVKKIPQWINGLGSENDATALSLKQAFFHITFLHHHVWELESEYIKMKDIARETYYVQSKVLFWSKINIT